MRPLSGTLPRSLPRTSLPMTLLLAPLALSPAGSPLGAQEVRRDTATLSPVVVTASRGTTGTRMATASTTVLDGTRLRAAGMTTVADALELVPGIAVARQGSAGGVTSLFVRGGESDYVRVLVDGVPVNEPGGFLNAANLTLDDVERIEIVRGPSSVLYGSEAVSGVVQIFTRGGARHASAARGSAAVSLGTRETLDASVSLGGIGRLGDYGVGVARHRAGGFLPFNDRFENTTISAVARTPLERRTTARASLRYSDGETRYPTEFTGEVTDSNSAGGERRLAAGLGVVRRLGTRADLELLASSTDVDGVNDDPADSPGDPDGDTRFARDSYRRSAGARATLRAAERTSVAVGADLEWQRVWSRYDAFGATGTPFTARRWSRALYAQALGDLGRAASYTAGLRWDDNEFYGRHLTYRVGGGTSLPAGIRLRAALGTGFKEPTLDEASAASVLGERLDPERSRGWEVGVERGFLGDRLVLGAAWFDQRFEDLIQFVGVTPTFEPIYDNVAEASSRGAELEARLRAAPSLTLGAAYTFLRTEVLAAEAEGPSFVVGEPLARRPRHHASASLEWRATDAARLHATGRWTGERPDVRYSADFSSERVTLSSFATVDAGGELRLARRLGALADVTLTARATNLLDERYESVAGFASPGRVVAGGLRLGF
jgi:vitamin B12 transporter